MNRIILVATLFCPVLAVAADNDDGENIPREFSIGVGVGVAAPSSTLAPNAASVRFRLNDSVTIEPNIEFNLRNGQERIEVPDNEIINANRSTGVQVGALGRFQVAERGNVELQGLGGAFINWNSTVQDPEGTENNNTTTNLGFGLNWGVGVNWWVSPNFAISGDASNPLFNVASTKWTPEEGDASQTISSLGLSIGFDPTIRMMGHVFF